MKCCVKKILVSHGFIAVAMKSTMCVSVNNVVVVVVVVVVVAAAAAAGAGAAAAA